MTGKTDLYVPEDGDAIPSIRPEAVSTVDREERDRWIVTTARRTVERLEDFDDLPEDVEGHYRPSLNEYRDMVREALRTLLEDSGEFGSREEPAQGVPDDEPPEPGDTGEEAEEPGDVDEWDFT